MCSVLLLYLLNCYICILLGILVWRFYRRGQNSVLLLYLLFTHVHVYVIELLNDLPHWFTHYCSIEVDTYWCVHNKVFQKQIAVAVPVFVNRSRLDSPIPYLTILWQWEDLFVVTLLMSYYDQWANYVLKWSWIWLVRDAAILSLDRWHNTIHQVI